MTVTRYPRPCPIPGHPQDDEPAPLASDSAWSRLRAWHLHAPAERLPLPVILTAWPAGWVLHTGHVPGHVVTYATVAAAVACWLMWHRYGRTSPHQRMLPTEAARRRSHRGLDRCGCHMGPARLARAPADMDLPGRRRLRLPVAASASGRAGRPRAQGRAR
jgi:hypothetical protein